MGLAHGSCGQRMKFARTLVSLQVQQNSAFHWLSPITASNSHDWKYGLSEKQYEY